MSKGQSNIRMGYLFGLSSNIGNIVGQTETKRERKTESNTFLRTKFIEYHQSLSNYGKYPNLGASNG